MDPKQNAPAPHTPEDDPSDDEQQEMASEQQQRAISPLVAERLGELARQITANPSNPKFYPELARRLASLRRHAEAETVLRSVIALEPRRAQHHAQLAGVLAIVGKYDDSIASFRAALAIDGASPVRKSLVGVLMRTKRFDEALAVWEEEIPASPHDPAPIMGCYEVALRANRFELAAEYAARHAVLRWSTRFWPEKRSDDPPYARMGTPALRPSKLRHDIEQLEYLKERGILTSEVDPILQALKRAFERVSGLGSALLTPLTQEERISLGAVYNRIVHVAAAPRVDKALSYEWDMTAIEDDYLKNPPGIIAVDRLLSDEALESLRRFCLESTIWLDMRYGNGYLGAMQPDGFNSPLVLQISEELRRAMPRVIGDLRIKNMWGYKYDQELAGITTHADAASVNVNFWLTPDDANLSPDSGGLIVWDAEAPLDWDFEDYNGPRTLDRIEAFLKESNAREISFPYKQNRAVIFNSDLFHRTAPLHFKPGYTNRRVNVTMLYGERGQTPGGAPARAGADRRRPRQ